MAGRKVTRQMHLKLRKQLFQQEPNHLKGLAFSRDLAWREQEAVDALLQAGY